MSEELYYKNIVIGGGAAGIACLKELVTNGDSNVLLLEKGEKFGGIWEGKGVYDSLHTNTTRHMMSFSDFPFTQELASTFPLDTHKIHYPHAPIYPHHSSVLKYLKAYMDHFKLTPYMRNNSLVHKIERNDNNNNNKNEEYWKWKIHSKNNNVYLCENLYICIGRYNDPRPLTKKQLNLNDSKFEGEIIFAQNYKNSNNPFKISSGKRVLIVGASVSAMDIATEVAQHTEDCNISIRTNRHVYTKYWYGKGIDQESFTGWEMIKSKYLTSKEGVDDYVNYLENMSGKYEYYGVPPPSKDFPLERRGTSSNQFLQCVAEGKIFIRKGVEKLVHPKTVVFNDGSRLENVDLIILGTGYVLNFPFFPKEIIEELNVTDDDIPLYYHTVHPTMKNIAFIGMFDQIGAYFPSIELQSRFAVKYLNNRLPVMPSKEEMVEEINKMITYKNRKHFHGYTYAPMILGKLAKSLNIEPSFFDFLKSSCYFDWKLMTLLFFGPLYPYRYRFKENEKTSISNLKLAMKEGTWEPTNPLIYLPQILLGYSLYQIIFK